MKVGPNEKTTGKSEALYILQNCARTMVTGHSKIMFLSQSPNILSYYDNHNHNHNSDDSDDNRNGADNNNNKGWVRRRRGQGLETQTPLESQVRVFFIFFCTILMFFTVFLLTRATTTALAT
jgi:hypothetical protein